MEIFGLTAPDAALAAEGLHVSQRLIELLFFQTHIGVLTFAIGFIWMVWQSSKEGNFKHLAIFVFISLAGFLLLIVPKRPESPIKSAAEVYGTTPAVTAQSLIQSNSSMPLMLSYLSQMADAVSFSAINRVDALFDRSLRFLSNPFDIQKYSLQAYQMIHGPLPDVGLREDVNNFIYASYVPALIMYQNDTRNLRGLYPVWPGQEQIVNYYSDQEKRQWTSIQARLNRLMNDSQGWQA
jgi:hypothetical protein